jgi:sialate O-acetylesterase
MRRFVRMWRVFGLCLLAGLCLAAVSARADVRLPAVIGDNMVLQRAMATPIWGWADAGETVTVSFLGKSKTAQPDASGKWMLKLDAAQAGGPFEMTIRGKNQLVLKNVLVGEVWLCSGQSNMQMTVQSSNNSQAEIAAADYPRIRLISVPTKGTQEPQADFKGQWAECSPKTVGGFSAAAYFFGRELQLHINVPIGLIHCSWGGSSCEAWVKRSLLEKDPQYAPLLQRWEETVATYDPVQAQAAHEKRLEAWKVAAAAAKKARKEAPRPPRNPGDPRTGQHRPANLYNGMLLPLMPYAIRGAIWYQGESNASRAYQYRHLFPLMIRNWREDWGQGDFPFYFVQLANFREQKPEPAESDWAELREAQTMTLKLPNTGQAVTIDIGDAKDIHPKNKQEVGRRLALWALARDYGRRVECSSPMYKSMEKEEGETGKKIVIHFDHVTTGIAARNKQIRGFAIAGADRKFVWADAAIDGQTVVVSSPKVADPVAVRYAWADNPVCNLFNQNNLPVCPFRTDTWPGITADAK